MTAMTDDEWRSFVTAGTRLAHVALARADGRPKPASTESEERRWQSQNRSPRSCPALAARR